MVLDDQIIFLIKLLFPLFGSRMKAKHVLTHTAMFSVGEYSF